MKICLISKYPRIEGGVSMRNYWMARALAERGHQVYVVTNAPEVESEYRIHLSEEDHDWYEPRFKKSKGFVKVMGTEPVSRKYYHVPWTNPFVTKLASIATRTIREHGCEAIYSYYFEPYGVAAHLASRWTGVPYILRHAGSDLGRLMEIPDLKITYEEILKAASVIVTQGNNVEIFTNLGVSPERIFTGYVRAVPTEVFNRRTEPMDVNKVLKEVAAAPQDRPEGAPAWRSDPMDCSKATIGIYGKVGEIKGSYDLLKAMGRLSREGLDFNLLAMTHGMKVKEAMFHQLIAGQGLASRTWILPFMPSWRVPSFIRRCTAVCFLERNFPIVMHGPTIPREVLACGTCLVVSLEIARKQSFVEKIIHGLNALVIRDPQNEEDLAAHLRFIITQPEKAAQIGAQGHKLSEQVEDYDAFVTSCENMFRQLAVKRRKRKARADQSAPLEQSVSLVRSRLPWTSLLLADGLKRWVGRFLKEEKSQTLEEANVASFTRFLSRMISQGKLKGPYTRDVLKYDMNIHPLPNGSSKRNKNRYSYETLLFRAGSLGVLGLGEKVAGDPKPYLLPHVVIETFDHDLEQLIGHLEKKKPLPVRSRQKTLVLFQRTPGRPKPRSYKINDAAAELVRLLDGAQSLEAICDKLIERHLGVKWPEAKESFITQSRAFLERLFENGAVGYVE
jgi:glycosyltransferase involved in cell wall biosynthesis